MSLMGTPTGLRLQIGLFGRRNVGKSSTMNALTRQSTSIVSSTAGTTTDPVSKGLELSPFGAVSLIDTAGVDDEGVLGARRVERAYAEASRVDVAVVVVDSSRDDWWSSYEDSLVASCAARARPVLVVVNKTDACSAERLTTISRSLAARGVAYVLFSATRACELGAGAPDLVAALARLAPESCLTPPPLVSDLVEPGSVVVLVTPLDRAAPQGRLILPQVQTLRELLEAGVICVVAQPSNLSASLSRLTTSPSLVITDSQAFKEVASLVTESVPLTSFSILFARQKGDLSSFYAGARALDRLTGASRVLVAESCAHRPIEEDIGTVKIPKMLRARYGESLVIDHVQGRDFPAPDALSGYDLIVHCGGCMTTRGAILSRIADARASRVAITNYGLALASLTGVLERAIRPFGLVAVD